MIRIHIARERLHSGQPPIVVEAGRANAVFAHCVEIDGPSQVVHDPKGMPQASGPRRPIHVWVQTNAAVTADGALIE